MKISGTSPTELPKVYGNAEAAEQHGGDHETLSGGDGGDARLAVEETGSSVVPREMYNYCDALLRRPAATLCCDAACDAKLRRRDLMVTTPWE